MVSKLIIRTVLLGIIALLSWAGWWAWSNQFATIAQKIILLLVEGGVLLAATSLLVETFQSFGSLSVKKRGWRGVFFAYNFYEEGQAIRTCELFALRSVILAIVALMVAMCVVVLWEAVKFLFNPHAITVDLFEIGKFFAQLLNVAVSAGVMIGGFEWLSQKFANRSQLFVGIVSGLYWTVSASIFLGITAVAYFKDPTFIAMPFYWAFLYASGIIFLALLFLGAVIGLGYGLFWLAGKAILSLSQRFPILAEVYNNICPVQTIHFVE